MDKKRKIAEVRERLDRTLALPDLVNEESIRSLVKDQLRRSSLSGNEENIGNVVVEKRTKEVSNFLQMLRSASGKDQNAAKVHDSSSYKEWKVKQDTEQLRVMYREGPHGTPFHTLLAEGYTNGPMDVCLCVSWESTLYKKWWPQYNFPTFKITMADCLQKVRIGEEISLMRVNVTWPVSDREVLLHYFEIDYFKEDLIIILLNTIPDVEDIDVSTHGFSKEGLPEAKDTVRVDLVGGFVLQKIDANRSYFRGNSKHGYQAGISAANSNKFCGKAAHRQWTQALSKVSSVATSDEDFRQALQAPMYCRVREGLDPSNKLKKTSPEIHEELRDSKDPSLLEISPITEIVEEGAEQNSSINQIQPIKEHVSKENTFKIPEQSPCSSSAHVHATNEHLMRKENSFISTEVENALRILDQAISFLRGCDRNQSDGYSINQQIPTSEAVANSCHNGDEEAPRNSTDMRTRPFDGAQVALDVENIRMDSSPRDDNHSDQRGLTLSTMRVLASHEKLTAENSIAMTQPRISESMRKVCNEESLMVNGFHGKTKSNTAKKKRGRCCLNLSLFRS